MNINELLNLNTSMYVNIKSHTSRPVSINDVLSQIKNGTYGKQITHIRELIQNNECNHAKQLKNELPAVTFCATFNERRTSQSFLHYNSLLVIDLDDVDDITHTAEILEKDEYVFSYWISPSGRGYKGLIYINYINDSEDIPISEKHSKAFVAIEEHLSKLNIIIDPSGKDITRLCFMSYDPNLNIKDNLVPFSVDLNNIKIKQHKGTSINDIPLDFNVEITWNKIDGIACKNKRQSEKIIIEKLYKYLKNRNKSITSSYDRWVQVAYAIASTFHSVYGRKIFMKLCELDGINHDAVRSEKLLFNAYRSNHGKCSFGTVVHFANEEGFVS